MKRAASLAAALALTASAHTAFAHRIDAHVSPAGVDFLEAQVPAYVPSELELPEVSGGFFCFEAAQRETHVQVEVHDVVLAMPRDGVLRLEIELSVDAEGDLFLNGCDLKTTCDDQVSLSHGRAALEFQLEVAGGQPTLAIHNLDLLVDEDDINVKLSNCALDDAVNFAISAAKGLAFDLILGLVEDVAANQLTPMIEGLLGGFIAFEGNFGPSDMQASILDVHAGTDGLHLAADVALSSNLLEPAACLTTDRPAPDTQPGFPPSLASGTPAHFGVAMNLGLLDDVLYNVWRSGLMCLSDAHFAAVGVDLHLDHHAGKLLPGFPPDTEFSLELRVMEPPRVEASQSDGARLTFVARGVEADLIGRHAGGADTIHVILDVDATARLDIDHDVGALVLTPEDVQIRRLEVDDRVGGENLGIDDAHLAHMLQTYVVPGLLEEVGAVPVTGSIVELAGHHVLLRDMFTTDGYLTAKVDLFAAPDDDTGRPTVAIESRPEGLVSAQGSVLRLTGSDPEIPSELLRYRVVVDGEERPLSFMREVQIGEVGHSQRHRVEVSAVDLAGNEDPEPIVMSVDVDGIAPSVQIDGDGHTTAKGATATISWSQSDDLSAGGEMVPRVLVYRVRDTSNILDVELVSEEALAPGTTSHVVQLGAHDLYRVEVRAADAAGNEGVASTLVSNNSGGCAISATGGPGGPATAMILALGFVALVRTRRAAAS